MKIVQVIEVSLNQKVKNKKDRVEEEKERSLGVVRGKLNNKNGGSSPGHAEFSDDGYDRKGSRRKKTKKQRDQSSSSQRQSSRRKQVRRTFSEDDYDATSSSGMDLSCTRRNHKHSRQVKSGAKIKKRPVVRTELWPHTIANEDDGEEVT